MYLCVCSALYADMQSKLSDSHTHDNTRMQQLELRVHELTASLTTAHTAHATLQHAYDTLLHTHTALQREHDALVTTHATCMQSVSERDTRVLTNEADLKSLLHAFKQKARDVCDLKHLLTLAIQKHKHAVKQHDARVRELTHAHNVKVSEIMGDVNTVNTRTQQRVHELESDVVMKKDECDMMSEKWKKMKHVNTTLNDTIQK